MNKDYIKKKLVETMEVAKTAYAPYSKFQVGSILVDKNGKEFKGINIENMSFPAGTCAERSALFSAVSNGSREFDHIFVISPKAKTILPPCGECRQALSEFVKSDFKLILANKNMDYKIFDFNEILPLTVEDSIENLSKIKKSSK